MMAIRQFTYPSGYYGHLGQEMSGFVNVSYLNDINIIFAWANVQHNINKISYGLNLLYPEIDVLRSQVSALTTSQSQIHSTLAVIDGKIAPSDQTQLLTAVTAIDTKLTALDAKVAQMDPTTITQSISFLLGAFVALAFVLASKVRY